MSDWCRTCTKGGVEDEGDELQVRLSSQKRNPSQSRSRSSIPPGVEAGKLLLPRGQGESLSSGSRFVQTSQASQTEAEVAKCPDIRRSGITVLYGDQESVIDIVFVHGLNGAPEKSWRHSQSPRDFFWPWELRNRIPEARVMLFGYDADISSQFGTNLIRIKNVAQSLLSAVVNKRQEDTELQRPLIFIGHSLGGLAIKRALVLASQTLETLTDNRHLIYNSTKGIIFFGTPNAGSALQSQIRVQILQSIARVAFIKVPPKLEEALREHSDELLDLSDDFRSLSLCTQKILIVYSYFEGRTTAKTGIRIVDETSARLNYDRETTLPIQADHQNMIKFEDEKDPSYEEVWGKIKFLTKSAINVKDEFNSQQKEFLDSFAALGTGNRFYDVLEPMSFTFKWIMDDSLGFSSWLRNIHPIYWIEGKPGSGKSTLMKYIVLQQELQRDGSRMIVRYFFNHRSSGEMHSLHSFLRSLIYQLLSQYHLILDQIMKEFPLQKNETDSQGSRKILWNVSALESAFKAIVTRASPYKRVFIFIDSLDECYAVQDIIQFIKRSVNYFDEKKLQVKFCLSSRPDSDLSSFLEGYPRVLLQSRNADDIRRYVEASTESFTESDGTESAGSLRRDIIRKADGVFLWAVLVLKALQAQHRAGDTISEMEKTLNEIPEDLEQLYDVMISKIKERHRNEGMLMLKSILYAQRPLGWLEVAYAVENDLKHISSLHGFDGTEVASLGCTKYMRRIQSRSGGLLEETLETKKIQFIHRTAKDFVQSSAELGDWMGDARSGNVLMLNACVQQLLFCTSQNYNSVVEGGSYNRTFTDYAVRHWIDHWKLVTVTQDEGQNQQHIHIDQSVLDTWTKHRAALQIDLPSYKDCKVTLLSLAVENDMYNYAKKNLTPENVNDVAGRYGTLLQAASSDGYENLVKLLLANKADVNLNNAEIPGGPWGNALRAASYGGYTNIVSQLLKAGADIDDQQGGWGTALQVASEAGHLEVVSQLLEAHADVNLQGGRWGSALKAACYRGHKNIVKELLGAGALINDPKKGQWGNALKAASYGGHGQLVEFLLEKGAEGLDEALCAACDAGHDQVVEILLNKGASPNALEGEYGYVLQLSAYAGHGKIVERLLSAGADVNNKGGQYGTALQGAAYSGHLKIIQQLLAAKANVHIKAGDWGNALEAAAYGGNIDIVQELLSAGAKVNCEGGRWGTPLKAASYGRHLDVVKLLLEKGANVNAQVDNWGNALKAAALGGSIEVVNILLDAGCIGHESAQETALEVGHDCVLRVLKLRQGSQ